MFLAVFLHKPADALAISTVLTRKRVARRKIAWVQLGYVAMIPVGAYAFCMTSGALGETLKDQLTGFALAFSAGTFIFIALSAILAMRIVRPPFQYVSILLGLLSYAALGLYVSTTYLGLGPGGMERMIVWPVLVWGLAFGGYLFASSPSASGTSATP